MNIIATAQEMCDHPPQYFLTLPNQYQGFEAFSGFMLPNATKSVRSIKRVQSYEGFSVT
jgi:hypothetical protein